MTSHRYHLPDEARSIPRLLYLFDNCERCAEIAQRPLALLDDEALRALWLMMVGVVWPQHRSADAREPQSDAEALAVDRLYLLAVGMLRMGLDPWHWPPRPDLKKLDSGQLVAARHQLDREISRRAERMSQ